MAFRQGRRNLYLGYVNGLQKRLVRENFKASVRGRNAAEARDQGGGVGRDLRMRSEKSFAFPAACAASLI
jgi:hypothetical protein